MKICAECQVQPVRQEWAVLCFDCHSMKLCPECGVSRVLTNEGEKIPCRVCELQKSLTDRSIERDPRYTLLHPPRICPVCNAKVLQGKSETCSDACRMQLSRKNRYLERSNGRPKNRVLFSVSGRKKFGDYLSFFPVSNRPPGIDFERMKELESGRAKSVSSYEICQLYESYPDILRVLLGIPWA